MQIPFTDIEFNFARKPKKQAVPTPTSAPQTAVEMPVKSGKSSNPDIRNLTNLVDGRGALINPEFAIEYLPQIEHLAMFNADVSYAVDNIVQLGTTPYKLKFDSSVSDTDVAKMINWLDVKKSQWYPFADHQGLTRDLLAQAVISGAVSAEIVPNRDLTGVENIVLVNTKSIRFVYNFATKKYDPFQKLNTIVANSMLGDDPIGLHPLNTTTYKYIAARRFHEKPYAIPPFLSALENVAIEKDMMLNVRSVVSKLGLLGFLNVLVTAPEQMVGESVEAYRTRADAYLSNVIPEVEKSTKQGFVVGFKDTHEFKMQQSSANISGAHELINLNTEQKMTGLKQDPLMLGRNFSTTEAIGRVIFAKLGTQVEGFQTLVANLLEYAFMMELKLAGFKFNTLTVKFERPILGDAHKESMTRQLDISNANALYNAGLISQDKQAQILGLDKADQQEPRAAAVPLTHAPSPIKAPKPVDGTTSKNSLFLAASKVTALEAETRKFDFSVHGSSCDHGHHVENFKSYFVDTYKLSKNTANLATQIEAYYNASVANYTEAVSKSMSDVVTTLSDMSKEATLEEVTDNVINAIYANWGTNFTAAQIAIIASNIEEAYKVFRGDKIIFGGPKVSINGVETVIPEATFNMLDLRTIEFFKNSDNLYMGTFITDVDTRAAMTNFIKEQYIKNNMPIGKGIDYTAFKKQFGNLMQGEEWKIGRIINTTANSMRNMAAVNYMDQVGVKTFAIVGVNDRKQCAYCKSMQGRTFSVSTAVQQVTDTLNSDPTELKDVKPFITTKFPDVAVMATMTNEQLQSAGIALPAYHSNCRDVIISVFES